MNNHIYKILLIDDHPLVRHGLSELISSEPDLEVCGEASTVKEAFKLITSLHPDIAIVDLSLKDGSGLELIKQATALSTSTKFLVFSMFDEVLYSERALHAGAMGYINKQNAMEEVINAIRRVLIGKIYLSETMTDRLIGGFASHQKKQFELSINNLSDRELEIYELIGNGVSTKNIADKLNISIKTVESHYNRIKIKLNVENYHDLVRQATIWVTEQG